MPALQIRRELPRDIGAIYALTKAAFGRAAEADLLKRLRDENALLLSQVALLDAAVVGHAGYSLVTVSAGSRRERFPALGPIAVVPSHQRRGIGGMLVRAGMAALRAQGHSLLFLVGHVSYYPRFGFQPALPLGFTCDYVSDPARHQHFMVAILNDWQPGEAGGHVRFHPAFDEA